jgi:predicted regulator of Ras-like GTPase activity (Roadblock/LC7/MglB family)
VKFISKTVEDMIRDGKLHQAVVVDRDGLVVDARGELYDPEVLSAFAFPLQQTLHSLQETLGLEKIKEVSLRTEDRKLRITLSFFVANAQDFCLMVLAPGAGAVRSTVSEIVHLEPDQPVPAAAPAEDRSVAPPAEGGTAAAGELSEAALEMLRARVFERLQPELIRIVDEAIRSVRNTGGS